MIIQKFICYKEQYFYDKKPENVEKIINDFINKVIKGDDSILNLERIKEKDIKLVRYREERYGYSEIIVKFKISFELNFSDYPRLCSKIDSILEELSHFFEIDDSDKIEFKETIYKNTSYYD